MSFDLHTLHEAYELVDEAGDSWAELDAVIDFESFRESLELSWRPESKPEEGGRPPWDAVLMFKVLLVGVKGGYSDERLERALTDSLSLHRFLGLELNDRVPDRSTIARYRSRLGDEGALEVFHLFDQQLEAAGYVAKGGQMLDSTFVLAPIQRNSREENQTIKNNDIPSEWQEDEATCKLRQKDTDGRWSKKNGKNFFGFKNHICADVKHKLIRRYVTTPANEHDSQASYVLIDRGQKQQPLYADSAYRSKEFERALRKAKVRSRVNFKATRSKPLSTYQRRENKRRSKVRARVEHIFGSMQNELGGKMVRTIGLEHAAVQVGLKNLLYNMHRFCYLEQANAC